MLVSVLFRLQRLRKELLNFRFCTFRRLVFTFKNGVLKMGDKARQMLFLPMIVADYDPT